MACSGHYQSSRVADAGPRPCPLSETVLTAIHTPARKISPPLPASAGGFEAVTRSARWIRALREPKRRGEHRQ